MDQPAPKTTHDGDDHVVVSARWTSGRTTSNTHGAVSGKAAVNSHPASRFEPETAVDTADIDLHDVQVAAARARVVADEKRGVATEAWIRRLADQAS